jgi:hypothetical protein
MQVLASRPTTMTWVLLQLLVEIGIGEPALPAVLLGNNVTRLRGEIGMPFTAPFAACEGVTAPGVEYVPMSGRLLPGDGVLPPGEIIAIGLANNPDLTFEVEVFNAELKALSPNLAAARVADSVRALRHGLAAQAQADLSGIRHQV